MSNIYFRGDSVFLYVKYNGKSIHGPKVRILHITPNDMFLEDLKETDMQYMGDGEYFYSDFIIPYDADFGQYQVIYSINENGKSGFTSETFYVINKSEKYDNAVKIYGYVYDIRTHVPLIDTSVTIKEKESNEVIVKSLTNSDGYWESYVYPGEYNFIFIKPDFNVLTINTQIGDEHRELQFNNITLESKKSSGKGNGIFSVGDKYITKNGESIRDLEIKIFNVFDIDKIIAADFTNEDGEWQCFLDQGTYLVKVGDKDNKKFDKKFRLKVDNNGQYIFVDLSKNIMESSIQYVGDGSENKLDNKKKVSNYVLDRRNNPIIDVQVNAFIKGEALDDKNIKAQTYTNIDGEWILFLEPNDYVIEFYHPKYKTYNENIRVD